MSSLIECPTCGDCVTSAREAHRGLLINLLASLNSNLLASREMLTKLQKKRWSKQFAEQHARDLKTIASLQERIARDEELLIKYKEMNQVCYG